MNKSLSHSDQPWWIREERRRSWEGYINPDTGMWITGDYYWTLNYCPMHLVVQREDGLEMRSTRHPKFWDGQFLSTHYILQSRQKKHHAAYLASRGKGKTTVGGGMLAKRFIAVHVVPDKVGASNEQLGSRLKYR